MTEDEIRRLLLAGLPGAEVEIGGDGYHVDVSVTSAEFDGMSRVKRQQRVYAVLNDVIRSGALHAVNIKASTPQERSSAGSAPR